MSSKKARSEGGNSTDLANPRRSSPFRAQSHSKNSARSMCSVDSQGTKDLSVAGSSIDVPVARGTKYARDLHNSTGHLDEHGLSKISKKPPSPRPRVAAAFKSSQSSAKSMDHRQRGSTKSKPKPAWLMTPNETPRSDISDKPSSVPSKPSLADFLDFDGNDIIDDISGKKSDDSGGIRSFGQSDPIKPWNIVSDAVPDTFDTSDRSTSHRPTTDHKESDKKHQLFSSIGNASDATVTNSMSLQQPGLNGFRQPKHTFLTKNKLEQGDDERKPDVRENAARTIQIWYRRFRNRKKAGQAALKRLMERKKTEVESRLSSDKLLTSQEQDNYDVEYQKKKRREEKARQARLTAIEELRNKREGVGKDKKATKNNMVFLQSSGKITKEKSSKADGGKATKPHSAVKDRLGLIKTDAALDNRPSTSSSVGRKVNAIFEESRSKSSKVEDDGNESAKSEGSAEESVATLKGSKTTFDDLMSTLKELESNPVEPTNFASARAKGHEERHNVLGESATSTQSITVPEEDQRYERVQEPLLSADKLQTIMHFLDEVERAEEDIRSEVTRQSRDSTIRGSFPAWNDDKLALEREITPSDSASQVATDIDNAIAARKQELSQKNESLNMLQRALHQQKEFSSLHVQEIEKEHKQQLTLQRKEYESTIQRHLSFIDQLIDDKKALSSRCEVLVKKLKETDEKYTSKIKKMEEDHALEMKKQKELMEAAEKLRREKWVQEKSKQIKEMTVKGLEPDIQRLIAKHKAEIKRLKASQQGELLESDERAGRKYIRQIEEMRERLEQEKDAAVQKEREIAKQRFEKQLEQEEESYQQQRRRLYSEVQDEKERIGKQIQAMRDELREEKDATQTSSKQSMTRIQEEHQKAVEEMERRHITELNNMKDQLEIEKQQWIENHMKKQEVYLLSKERELKESVRDTRDKEIEMVIARLEDETARAREENSKASENRIKRIVEKYENELKELERSEKLTQEKYTKLKVQIQEQEGEDLRLKSQIKQKEQEVTDMRRLTDQLQQERGKVSDIIRQEFADRLVTLEEDNKRLRTEMNEMRARHRLEIDRISNEKESEMEEVHKRVKQAVSKKEETTNILRQQMKAAEKRAEQLEMLLAEQRKKLLS